MHVQEAIDEAYKAIASVKEAQQIAREAIRQRDILLDMLRECDAWFADRADVTDGDDGAPVANEEMRMQMGCDEAISKCGF